MRGISRLLTALAAASVGLMIMAGAGTTASSAASLSWSPSTDGGFDFGWLPVGQTVTQRFTLENSGTSASPPLTIEVKGSTVFTLAADHCTGTHLGLLKTCRVGITYSRARPGRTTPRR